MRLEEISAEGAKELSNSELKNLRERANQIYQAANLWAKQLQKNMVSVTQPIGRDRLMESYYLIVKEMASRGLPAAERRTPLDAKLTRKRLRGVDVGDLPPIMVREGVVSLSGDFVRGPKSARQVEVRLDADGMDEVFSQELEKRMVEALYAQAGLPTAVHRDAKGLDEIIPMYDLVLVPRAETVSQDVPEALKKRLSCVVSDERAGGGGSLPEDGENVLEGVLEGPSIEFISKPYPTEHASPQLSGPWDTMASKRLAPGVRAILGIRGGKSKVASVRFKASKFTPAQAKAWLKSHGYKTNLEPASGEVKKVGVGFVKNAEQRLVGGVVYAPGKVDSQGDYVEHAAEIFEGMKGWMLSGHPMKFMHEGKAVDAPLVECFQADRDTFKSGELIPAGAWYISNYIPENQDGLWKAIKDGTIGGYSMAGEAEVDEV